MNIRTNINVATTYQYISRQSYETGEYEGTEKDDGQCRLLLQRATHQVGRREVDVALIFLPLDDHLKYRVQTPPVHHADSLIAVSPIALYRFPQPVFSIGIYP